MRMKRLLSALAALCLCLALLPPGTARAAGTPTRTEVLDLRTFTNPGTVEENAAEGWRWEVTGPQEATLTLTNCYISPPNPEDGLSQVLSVPRNWTCNIVLNGDNVFEDQKGRFKQLVGGETDPTEWDPVGTEDQTTFVIKGPGSLDIRSTAQNPMCYGFGGRNLTIEGGTITSNICFCTIGGAFRMTGGSLKIDQGTDDGIFVHEGPVQITGGTVDIRAGLYGIVITGIPNKAPAKDVTISGGDVKIQGTYGIFIKADAAADPEIQSINLTGGEISVSGGAV